MVQRLLSSAFVETGGNSTQYLKIWWNGLFSIGAYTEYAISLLYQQYLPFVRPVLWSSRYLHRRQYSANYADVERNLRIITMIGLSVAGVSIRL